MAKTIDLTAAMSETKAANFARAIDRDPKAVRGFLRRLGFRASETPVLTEEVQLACIKHFHGEEAVPAPSKGKKKAKA